MKLRFPWPARSTVRIFRSQRGVRRHPPTPIPISPRTRNVLFLLSLGLILLIVWKVPTIVTLLLGGGALALLLSFPVRLLSRVMPRGLAIALSLLLAIGAIGLAVSVVVPILVEQLRALVDQLPRIAESLDRRATALFEPLERRGLLRGTSGEFVDALEEEILVRAETMGGQLVGGLAGMITSAFSTVITLFGVMFIAVYLVVDARALQAGFLRMAPRGYRRDALDLWNAFSLTLSRYFGGLGLSLLIQGALSALALYVLGVPYALLLGAWVAVTAIIPYLGAWLGSIPAVLLALSVSPMTAILTALLFLAIQQFESNVLTPQIQSQAVRVHPILVLLSIFAGGALAGLAGVIFAVPVLAVLRVLVDFFGARLRTVPPHEMRALRGTVRYPPPELPPPPR